MTSPAVDIRSQPRSHLVRFISWWSRELAGSGTARASRKTKPWLAMLMCDDSQCVVYQRKGLAIEPLGRFDPGGPEAAMRALADVLKKQGVTSDTLVLRLAPSQVIRKRLSLPVGVREVLRQVLANKIETIAPWPADQALYGYREVTGTSAGGTDQIAVDVWVIGRARVDRLLADLGRCDLRPSVVDVGDSVEAPVEINLITPAGDGAEARRVQIARALSVAAVATVLLSGFAIGQVMTRERKLSSLESQVQLALKQADAAARPGSDVRRRANTAALTLRHEQPAAAIVLEALSRTLPDDAALDRLELRAGVLTITGKAHQVPALIALLEASPHFENVEFAAPTTREDGSDRSIFSITATVRPHMMVEVR